MKNLIFTMLCMVALIVFDACSKDETFTVEESLTEIQGTIEYKYNSTPFIDSEIIISYIESLSKTSNSTLYKTEESSVPVFDETFTMQADGYSTIKTNKSGVTFNYLAYNMSNLDPSGHAVTLWAVFFDLGVIPSEETITSMYQVSGHVIGDDGVIEFGGRVNEGQEKDLWVGVPLKDINNTQLVVIAKTHGPAIPGIINEQLSELEGGCNGDGPDPAPPCYEFVWSYHLIQP